MIPPGTAGDHALETTRFDDGDVIRAIIADLRGKGFELDDLDVHLSRFGPVDLDLLHDCLREQPMMAQTREPVFARAA
jgi:hypothetical protein